MYIQAYSQIYLIVRELVTEGSREMNYPVSSYFKYFSRMFLCSSTLSLNISHGIGISHMSHTQEVLKFNWLILFYFGKESDGVAVYTFSYKKSVYDTKPRASQKTVFDV